MTRMGKELSLVLVGATMLTAGYFYFREDDQAADSYTNDTTHNHSRAHPLFIPMMMRGFGMNAGGGAPRTSGSVTRGGFGSTVSAHSSGS
jgi:hypothetical protein